MRYVYKGVTMMNQFWFRSKETDPLTTFQAVTDKIIFDFDLGIWARMKQVMCSSAQLVSATALMLTPPGVAQTIKSYTTDFGSVAGDGLPPHDAGLLSLYTGYPGRRVHGRLYIGAVPESQHNQGEMDSTYQFSMKNFGDWLVGQFGESGTSPNYWMVIYSRKNGRSRQPGPPPFYSYSPLAGVPIKKHVVNVRVATQRHRKLGRGM